MRGLNAGVPDGRNFPFLYFGGWACEVPGIVEQKRSTRMKKPANQRRHRGFGQSLSGNDSVAGREEMRFAVTPGFAAKPVADMPTK